MVITRPESKIMLNDDNDGVELVWPNGGVAHAMAYEKAVRNQSYNKSDAGWQWSTAPTPGSRNTIVAANVVLPKKKKSANNNAVSAQTAAVVLPIDESFGKNKAPAATPGAQILFLAVGAALLICGAGVTGYYFFKNKHS